jgi:hypothetical protein
MVADVKERALEQGEVHRFSLGCWEWSATWKPKLETARPRAVWEMGCGGLFPRREGAPSS